MVFFVVCMILQSQRFKYHCMKYRMLIGNKIVLYENADYTVLIIFSVIKKKKKTEKNVFTYDQAGSLTLKWCILTNTIILYSLLGINLCYFYAKLV